MGLARESALVALTNMVNYISMKAWPVYSRSHDGVSSVDTLMSQMVMEGVEVGGTKGSGYVQAGCRLGGGATGRTCRLDGVESSNKPAVQNPEMFGFSPCPQAVPVRGGVDYRSHKSGGEV